MSRSKPVSYALCSLLTVGITILGVPDEGRVRAPMRNLEDRVIRRLPAAPALIINELHIAPTNDAPEFVELFVRGTEALDLSRYKLQDSRRSPVVLSQTEYRVAPGSYLVMTPDTLSFQKAFPDILSMQIRPWPTLNNGGDTVELKRDEELVEHISYTSDQVKKGRSLERVDPAVPSFLGSNWGVSTATAGATPGRRNSLFAPDLTAPELRIAEYTSVDSIAIEFSESIDPQDLADGAIQIDGRRVEVFSWLVSFARLIIPAASGSREIYLSGIRDFAGNEMPAVKRAIAQRPITGDVIISEIMFQPEERPEGPAPEFVEIMNRDDGPISISRLKLCIGYDFAEKCMELRQPGRMLEKDGVAVLYAERSPARVLNPEEGSTLTDIYPEMPVQLRVVQIPRAGTSLGLKNSSDLIRIIIDNADAALDSVRYTSAWHDRRYTETRGRSLELIDPDRRQPVAVNWTTSMAPAGASPGRSGDTFNGNSGIRPETGTLRFNEILYDPVAVPGDGMADQPEFIELTNIGSSTVDLNGIYLISQPSPESARDSLRLVYRPTPLMPGQVVSVFTLPDGIPDGDPPAVAFIRDAFPEIDRTPDPILIPIREAFDLSNQGEHMHLVAFSGEHLDEVRYSPEWHQGIVSDASGLSLERILATGGSNDPANWTTSTSVSGATPGQVNSVTQIFTPPTRPGEPDTDLIVEPRSFSPNRDGVDDRALIRVPAAASPSTMQMRIFDLSGRTVRTLVRNALFFSEDLFIWDGRGDNGRELPSGIYIVLVEIFSTRRADTRTMKQPVALIR